MKTKGKFFSGELLLIAAAASLVINFGVASNPVLVARAASPSVQVVSPNGGDNLRIGETKRVFWSSTGVNYVRLYIQSDIITGSGSVNYIYEYAIPASIGYFDWTIQKSQLPAYDLDFSKNYKIRVDGVNETALGATVIASDYSDNTFNVINPLTYSVRVLSPNGGEQWEAGREYTISWNSDIVGEKVISFYKGGNYISNIHATGNSVLWTVDTFFTPGNDYKIRVSDMSSTSYDDSDNNFSITNSQYITEGAIIQAYGDIDVYIVKYVGLKKFKRLVLSPSVFASYGHLKWENLMKVTPGTLKGFTTSSLVRSASNGRMYVLYPSGDMGTRRYIPSMAVFNRNGYDLDSVYEINGTDENSYIQSANIN